MKSPRHVFNETTQVKKNRTFLLAGLCVAGFLCGFAGKRLAGGGPDAASGAHAAGNHETRAAAETADDPPASTRPKPGAAKASTLRSTDTLETILALGDQETYGRLALWMLDASEQDIAAYWQSYRQKQDRSNDIADLIFINWTRLNPQGAIAAAAGTPNEQHAWWAWACHDPQTALATVLATKPDRLNNVAWGIGEFHGDWLRAHFDEIPEDGRRMAIMGLTKWDDGAEPLDTLKFLKEHDAGFNTGIFNSLVRKDPWAAFDWIQESGGKETSKYGGTYDTMSTFVKTMAEVHPDVLERLARQTPSGELKRKMEAALFDNLLLTDPEAAIEQAKATKAPRIAVERLAAAGLSLVAKDPDRAFEMAESMFATSPDALMSRTTVTYPNGGSSSEADNEEASRFMNALLAKDPARVMAMNPPQSDASPHGSSGFSQLAGKWAEQDLVGYSEWVNQQTDPAIREPAAIAVINQLQGEQQYADAVEWAMSLNRSREGYLRSLYRNWSRTNPDEALQWLESSNLPETEINQLKSSNSNH